jgi:hypothetical protein
MQQTQMLPRQSLQDLANWGNSFLARPTSEKEFVQIYGKPLYHGAIAFSKWWRSLSIGQIQALKGIDFPYWTLAIARKLALVPLKRLNDCLGALQKGQKSVSKLSRLLNKFIQKEKLSFGRAMTQEDWDLIARSLNLDALAIDVIRQKAELLNGRQSSQQQVTTDDVIEILREEGYRVEQILPKPRVKRYSLPEVEQLIGLKVQEAVQTKELELLTALERSRYLETENERLMTRLRTPSQCPTTVEVTPITEEEREQPDLREECLGLWGMSFSVGDRVRVVDNTNNDDYGKVGIIKGQSKSDLALWWVQLSNGDYKQFPTSALEILPQGAESESIPTQERVVQTFSKIEQVPMAG